MTDWSRPYPGMADWGGLPLPPRPPPRFTWWDTPEFREQLVQSMMPNINPFAYLPPNVQDTINRNRRNNMPRPNLPAETVEKVSTAIVALQGVLDAPVPFKEQPNMPQGLTRAIQSVISDLNWLIGTEDET